MERPFYHLTIFLFSCCLALPVQAPAQEFPTCPSRSLWKARGALARLISKEALRVAKEKLHKDTSPKLKAQCKTLSRHLEQAGDGAVLFIGLNSELYQTIASFSRSWVSHTGVAFYENSGWVVYESRAPSGQTSPTPLCDFLARSAHYRVAVAKPQVPFSDWQVEKLRLVAGEKMKKDYDFTFDLKDPDTQFCSKMVYESFKEIGLSLGRQEDLRELFETFSKNETEKERMACFFTAWFQGNLLWKKGEWKNREVIPWEQLTLTPASQYESAVRGKKDPHEPFALIYESK